MPVYPTAVSAIGLIQIKHSKILCWDSFNLFIDIDVEVWDQKYVRSSLYIHV